MIVEKPNAEQMKAIYKEYLECFNNKDFEKLKDYLDENLYFYRGDEIPPLVGRSEMFAFFNEAWKHFNEVPEASCIEAEVPVLKAFITNRLRVFKDWPDSDVGAFHAGDDFTISGYVHYVFNENGKIAVIIDSDYASE